MTNGAGATCGAGAAGTVGTTTSGAGSAGKAATSITGALVFERAAFAVGRFSAERRTPKVEVGVSVTTWSGVFAPAFFVILEVGSLRRRAGGVAGATAAGADGAASGFTFVTGAGSGASAVAPGLLSASLAVGCASVSKVGATGGGSSFAWAALANVGSPYFRTGAEDRAAGFTLVCERSLVGFALPPATCDLGSGGSLAVASCGTLSQVAGICMPGVDGLRPSVFRLGALLGSGASAAAPVEPDARSAGGCWKLDCRGGTRRGSLLSACASAKVTALTPTKAVKHRLAMRVGIIRDPIRKSVFSRSPHAGCWPAEANAPLARVSSDRLFMQATPNSVSSAACRLLGESSGRFALPEKNRLDRGRQQQSGSLWPLHAVKPLRGPRSANLMQFQWGTRLDYPHGTIGADGQNRLECCRPTNRCFLYELVGRAGNSFPVIRIKVMVTRRIA